MKITFVATISTSFFIPSLRYDESYQYFIVVIVLQFKINSFKVKTFRLSLKPSQLRYRGSKAITLYVNDLNIIYQMGDCLSSRSGPPHRNQSAGNSNPQPNNNLRLQQQNFLRAQQAAIGNIILHPIFPVLVSPNNHPQLGPKFTPIEGEEIEIKVPKDVKTWVEFDWKKQQKYNIPIQIALESLESIRLRSFQQKYAFFRFHLQKLRIHWSTGKSDYLNVDRLNLLMTSNNQFEKINFHKEVKIVFDGEQASDAGGLIRQWMNLCIKEIFNPELGMFKLCDSTQTFYKFAKNQSIEDFFQIAAKILGIVLGKAIFQRIPLNCPLNYTILRQICSQPIQLNDVYSYDKDLYNGWKFLITEKNVTALQQNFCVYEFDEHGTQMTIPLKDNGFNIMVKEGNTAEFISLCIDYYCRKSTIKLLDNLKYGIYKIIPPQLLSIFYPHELDIIINGKQEINVQDLKKNTVYDGYTPTHIVIKWFWEYLQTLSIQKLNHFLHFVTGNTRVPLLGFKYLESNRGAYQLFTIKKIDYNPVEPYPKSHTCFNRLELQSYPSKEIFDKYIVYVSCLNQNFGLD